MASGTRMMDHDLIVVGGGAAGLAAVRAARRAGADVALVSDSAPGGECTFTGCVPSKTLLAAARDRLDFASAIERVRATVARIAATESIEVLRSEGITVIEGTARLVTHDTVAVGDSRITAPRIVLATGSRPAIPDDVRGLADCAPLTSDTVFDLEEAPASLAIIGGGPTGCELAQAFAAFGTDVTIFERHQQLLPGEEPEAAALIRVALQSAGVTVRRVARVASVEATGDGFRVAYRLDRSGGLGGALTVEKLLVAAGREPRTEGLGVESVGVKLGQWSGFIVTDERLETTLKGVYAAGDAAAVELVDRRGRMPSMLIDKVDPPSAASRVRPPRNTPSRLNMPLRFGVAPTAAPRRTLAMSAGVLRVDRDPRKRRKHYAAMMLAHAADEMGRIAAGNALGKGPRGRLRGDVIPRVTYTDPEVASVGVPPRFAPPGSRVAYLPLAEVDRAIADGRTDGFIAIVAGPRRVGANAGGGRILGATIVGRRAGEMIAEIVLVMRTGAFAGRLAQTLHAYPTYSSGVQKAAAQFFAEIDGRTARSIS